jgi:hypothetical protein
MLADVAGKAQDAALAQFEVDKTTMSAKDAADKYAGTLAAQRTAFEESAKAAGFNADEVKALADQVFAMPTEKQVEILAETANAQSKITSFIETNSGRQIRLTVTADGLSSIQLPNGMTATSRANGGILPGAPSSTDNMFIHAASGEFVVNAAATQRNRALLEAINSGSVRGYADGGQVQPQYVTHVPYRSSSDSVQPAGPAVHVEHLYARDDRAVADELEKQKRRAYAVVGV